MADVIIDDEGARRTVTLNKPECRNAFDASLIKDLTAAFETLPKGIRVIVLRGAGKVFCAGADIRALKASLSFSESENAADAEALAGLFRTLDECAAIVVGQVHGVAMGGGAGLVACCDIVVMEQECRIAFSEVRLGIVPAVISSFVIPKIGVSAARRYFTTGEVIASDVALRIGLVHEVVAPEAMNEKVEAIVAALLQNGPEAIGLAKKTIRALAPLNRDAALKEAVKIIAALRIGAEAQEGFSAFSEKRLAVWPKA